MPLPGAVLESLDFPTFRIGLIAKIMDRLTIRQLLDQDSMSYAEWRVMMRLSSFEDGGTVSQIADLAWVDPAEVSRAVSTLEKRKLLVRRKSPSDGRVSIMSLTSEGKAQFRETLARRTAFHESLLVNLSTQDRETLDALLARIGTNLKASLDESLSHNASNLG